MSHNVVEPTRTEDSTTHPAFATASVSHIHSNTAHTLFGSDVDHDRVVRLTINAAHIDHSYGSDKVLPDSTLIAVDLSPTQWAQLISGAFTSKNVPVTLAITQGVNDDGELALTTVPPLPPQRSRIAGHIKAINQITDSQYTEVLAAVDNIEKGVNDKVGIREMRERVATAYGALCTISSNRSYTVSRLHEAMVDIVEQATTEINDRAQEAGLNVDASQLAPELNDLNLVGSAKADNSAKADIGLLGFPRTPDDLPRIDVAETNLSESVASLVPALRDAGFRIFILDNSQINTYIYIAKNDRVGHIEYSYFDGYQVYFAVDPARKVGTGLIALDPDNPDEPITDVEGIIRAAHVATGYTHHDVHNPGNVYPNDGWSRIESHPGFKHVVEVVSTPTEQE